MWTLISFASIILSTYGQTRYVIDNYTLPDTTNLIGLLGGNPTYIRTGSPYPLDVCVGYEVAISVGAAISLAGKYGKYSCNANKDAVIFTDYGLDENCATVDGTNDKTLSYDATLGAGEIGAFNCDGENSYVQIIAYTISGVGPDDEDGGTGSASICCGDSGTSGETFLGYVTTTLATDVCVYASLDGNDGYTSGTCDNTGATSNIYDESDCSGVATGTSDTGSASTSYCGRLGEANQAGTIYRRQTNCVVDGVMDNPAVGFCETAEPTTAEPTEATDPPTKMPSVSPTAATDDPSKAPTGSPTTAAPTEQDTSSTGYMNIVNYIVLLIMGMAIFVN